MPRLRSKNAQRREWEAREFDEMWTFVSRRKRKVWLWLAIERANRRIVALVTGRRDAASAHGLWRTCCRTIAAIDGTLPTCSPPMGRPAPLAAMPLLQRQRRHERHRSHHLLLAPTLRGTGPETLLF